MTSDGKWSDGERVADGPGVATKRGIPYPAPDPERRHRARRGAAAPGVKDMLILDEEAGAQLTWNPKYEEWWNKFQLS